MKRKTRRLYFVALGLLALGTATALVLTAFNDKLVYFYSPSELQEQELGPDRRLRIGGLVAEDSIQRDGSAVAFSVTDLVHSVPVVFTGLLPDLFREGQGVVAEGRLGRDGVFQADEVLAKHDENYMPPEVQKALEDAGVWQHAGDGQSGDGPSGEGQTPQ